MKNNDAKILVIEDDVEWQEVLSELLTQKGYNVTTCDNFKNAIITYNEMKAKTPSRAFDLVFADIKLSGEDSDGLDLIKIFRQDKINVFVISGFPDFKKSALEKGAAQFFEKTDFSKQKEEILKLVEQYLSLKVSGRFSLKISKLKLKNYRSFIDNEFYFSDQFTLIVGDNGAGKTAILDALSALIGSMFVAFDGFQAYHINDEDVFQVLKTYEDTVRSEPVFPASIEMDGIVADMEAHCKLSLHRTNKEIISGDPLVADISSLIQESVQKGERIILPVIVYYGTGRLWLQKMENGIDPSAPGSRLDGYQHALEPILNEKNMVRWLKTREYEKLQRKSEPRLYSAVKRAIIDCIEEYDEIWYDVKFDSIIVKNTDGQCFPAHMLSDGYRNMLAMTADIAYRMAMLNPHLGLDVTRKTPGVILIDEIALHLHPKWQRGIVDNLKRTFPNVQIISTTHSPFIIQSLRPGELINLSNEISTE